MKIRTDFVTNSSSASYLLTFKVDPDIKKDAIKDVIIDRLVNIQRWVVGDPEIYGDDFEEIKKEKDPKKRKEMAQAVINSRKEKMGLFVHQSSTDPNTWSLHEETIMHNSYTDGMPLYMIEFIMAMLAQEEKGFRFIRLETNHDG